jgi:hypothetical protein
MIPEITLITNQKLNALLGSDPVLTGEYFDRMRRKYHLQPEKRLMFAVLEDAVKCLRKYAGGRNGREQRLFRQTQEWIMAKDEDWPFSFVSICEAFGLDQEYLRSALIRKSITVCNPNVRALRATKKKNATVSHGILLLPQALVPNTTDGDCPSKATK